MQSFKAEKGKEVLCIGAGVGVRVTISERTDPRLVIWLNEAIERVQEQRNNDAKRMCMVPAV